MVYLVGVVLRIMYGVFMEIMLDKREKVSYHGYRSYFDNISVLTFIGRRFSERNVPKEE